MSHLVIEGGHVITPHEERFTNVWVDSGRIAAVADNHPRAEDPQGLSRLDARGCYVTPGLIDLQVNGDPSCNLWGDPTKAEFDKMRSSLLRAGVTGFLPTLITDEIKHLRKNVELIEGWIASASEPSNEPLARPLGIHLEGPCLSPEKPGVHPRQWVI